jgi:RNA polymerase sigma-70 factor (ECF subfamily)
MDENEFLAEQFEQHRNRLRAVAYKMLGSVSDADDAVQETWLRLSRDDRSDVENLGGWLTTVVVLEMLSPAERLAFVLHDMFAVPFDEIAPMVDRSPEAARQLASRARRRVRGEAPEPTADVDRQREVVDAFFAAARDGDFDRLVAVLHPDVVLRADGGEARRGATAHVHGAEAVARRAMTFAHLSRYVRPALVNGVAGVVVAPRGRPFAVMAFTITDGRIAAIDALADPERLSRLDLAVLG